MLASSSRADFAVGYFFMSGFQQVSSECSGLEQIRILVGRTDRPILDVVAASLQQADALKRKVEADDLVRRRSRSEIAQEAIGGIADGISLLPQTDSVRDGVSMLRELIDAGKLLIRTYPRSPLHAKAYICWYEDGHAEPGSAVVGSSNLTLAGFEGNTELNVRVTGDAEMTALRDWFNALWEDSEDIGPGLVAELDRSWALAQTPPYHVYLKALLELYSDETPDSELPELTQPVNLANFQLDAVRQALSMIANHGGCYVGDVVGLGKTYVGSEILRQLRFSYPNDGPPLILCPAGLIPMWEAFNERFSLGATVVSHSMIAAAGEPEFDEELGQYLDPAPPDRGIVLAERFENRGPVLVDEAHNFRNLNQRRRGLTEFLEAGDHKVILLSATPQNLGPLDIYRQLRLFLDQRDHGLPLEPVDLEEYFGNARRWLDYRTARTNYLAEYRAWQKDPRGQAPPIPPRPPEAPLAEISEVLRPVFIRRRRRDIAEVYGDSATIDGEPIRFPEPQLENIEYRLDRVYVKAGSFEQFADELRAHRAARYHISRYLLPECVDVKRYDGLRRARDRVAGLTRVLLLKRLESSVAAFASTLESFIRSNRNFRSALVKGYVPVGKAASRLLSGQEFSAVEALEILEREESEGAGAFPTADFDTGQWISDLDADHQVLTSLLQRIGKIGPDDDDKLRAIKEFLRRPEVRSEKVLIFSEAETTIDYLFDQLNPGGKDPTIARLSGSNRKSVADVVTRFSPGSNLAPGRTPLGPAVRVLLATDIVSEGQNLQDCGRIVNYDLHWNPVRLIQRFGRVDRIGSMHSRIYLHSMWPDLAVDAGLALTDRLRSRIQLFHDVIGLDNRLLTASERLNSNAMFRVYVGQELPDLDDGLDDVSIQQRAAALLQRIRHDDPELWTLITNLPDGIRAAVVAGPSGADDVTPVVDSQPALLSPQNLSQLNPSPFEDPRPGESLVLLSAGRVRGCYAVGSALNPRQISPAQFAVAAECDPDEALLPLPADTNRRVMAAYKAFQQSSGSRLGMARRPRDSRARRYVARQLRTVADECSGNPSAAHELDSLRQVFAGNLPGPCESALREIRSLGLTGQALLARLRALREKFHLSARPEPETENDQAPQVVRIVCSDALTN